MKKNLFRNLTTFIMVALISLCFTSCSDDDSLPDSEVTVPDPEGTVSALMTARGLDFFNYQSKLYVSTSNSSEWKFGSLNACIDIYDCGNVRGLADITSIPTSGWVKARNNPIAQIGHGYVVRYRNLNFQIILHARMYITGQGDQGLYVKYQTPFDPSAI